MSYSIAKKIKCYAKVFSSLLKANLLNKHIPFMLEFQVTKACNLTCNYCYADLENLYDKDYSLQQLKDIVDEFYDMGTRVVRILGGEPMASLFDILEAKICLLKWLRMVSLFRDGLMN